MIKMRFAMGLVVAGIWAAVSLPSWAEDKEDAALLAKSLAEASVSLDQGLKASEREGTPISAKFEMEGVNSNRGLSLKEGSTGEFRLRIWVDG
jgi:hypothetical protein